MSYHPLKCALSVNLPSLTVSAEAMVCHSCLSSNIEPLTPSLSGTSTLALEVMSDIADVLTLSILTNGVRISLKENENMDQFFC